MRRAIIALHDEPSGPRGFDRGALRISRARLVLCDRLDLRIAPEHVGRQVQQPVWSLPYIADPLTQLEQQRFAATSQAALIEDNPRQLRPRQATP